MQHARAYSAMEKTRDITIHAPEFVMLLIQGQTSSVQAMGKLSRALDATDTRAC